MKHKDKIINYCLKQKSFYLTASNKSFSSHSAADTQRLPLYDYTEEGEPICNIPDADWEIERVNAHYRQRCGKSFEQAVGATTISAENMLPYAYTVLHDPVYRYDLKGDPTRELPHLPLYRHFGHWANLGRKLLDLHANFIAAASYPLKRNANLFPNPPNVMLRANAQDREQGVIYIDDQTTLSGIPEAAWHHKFGNHSALEWVLNRYKTRLSIETTRAEESNIHHFIDHKERIIDLLMRVCAGSVKTMRIVDSMAYWQDGKLMVFDDREEDVPSRLSLTNWAREGEEERELDRGWEK